MNVSKRAKTRREVLQAFWQLCKDENTDAINITSIMQKAGYSRQTFYQYFRDINELKDLVYSVLDPVQNALARGQQLSFENLLDLYLQQYSGHGFDSDLQRILEKSPEFNEAHTEYACELLWQTHKTEISIQREEFELLFKSFEGAMTTCLSSWREEYQDSIPLERVSKLLNLIFDLGYRELIFGQATEYPLSLTADDSRRQSHMNGFVKG